jgi:hypothetical protein
MLLAETITEAAKRWLLLLRTSTYSQAWSIIRADAKYTDLTPTQYSGALDWLKAQNFLVTGENGFNLHSKIRMLPPQQTNQILFERILESSNLPWLPDSDIWVPDASEMPQDAAKLGAILGLTEQSAFLSVRQVHGHIDLARRALIGAAGEKALFAFLEQRWPGATTHVAESNDGFGYDLAFLYAGTEWHLEVKSTVRRGRLLVHLSRHEFEVGVLDPNWRLIVVALNADLQMQSFATARFKQLIGRAPQDICPETKWQSASYQLATEDLSLGFDFAEGVWDKESSKMAFPLNLANS